MLSIYNAREKGGKGVCVSKQPRTESAFPIRFIDDIPMHIPSSGYIQAVYKIAVTKIKLRWHVQSVPKDERKTPSYWSLLV